MVNDNDPLWKMRHALAGMGLALVLSVLSAALAGRWLGEYFDGDYGVRVTIYGALLLYALIGAVLLFIKIAQHETRPLTVTRVLLWWASLWLWPLLLLGRRKPGGGD